MMKLARFELEISRGLETIERKKHVLFSVSFDFSCNLVCVVDDVRPKMS